MAELTVIRWRDIPMQVRRARRRAARARGRCLPDRFQEAVDAAAMVAGLIGTDDYTEQMRMDARDCGDDLQHEVDTETVRDPVGLGRAGAARRRSGRAACAAASRSPAAAGD